MNENHSLLAKIKSSYILKDILTLAFKNMNSVLKFVAYNKALLNKLDINFKDYYDFKAKEKTKIEIDFNNELSLGIASLDIFSLFIPLLIYIIMFYSKGTFNDKNLKEEYDKKKKNYVDIMNKYILLSFLAFHIIFIVLNIILLKKIFSGFLKNTIFFFLYIFYCLIYLIFDIAYIIKFSFTIEIIKKLKDIKKKAKTIWFYYFDIVLIIYMFSSLLWKFIKFKYNIRKYKLLILNQINGFHINNFTFYLYKENSNKIGKIKKIFKKENMKEYKSELNDNQIRLINNINQLRKENNIRELKYDEKQKFPDYLMNKKTELFFYKEKNIYKFNNNYYLIKYPISESQKDITDKNIINIITIDILERINIMQKDEYYYIALYNDHFDKNENIVNNNINNNLGAKIDLPSNNNIDTESRLNNNYDSINLSTTRVNNNMNVVGIRNIIVIVKIPLEK